MDKFKEINFYDFSFKVFDYIDNKWALIVVGNEKNNNCMTASWLSLGILWNYPIVNVFIRPTRYTYTIFEKSNFFSVSFFDDNFKDKLEYCGMKSGRLENKFDKCKFNLNFYSVEDKLNFVKNIRIPFVEESKILFLCEKIYFQDLDNKNFLDSEIEKHYNNNDYHRMYVGRILKIFIRE
ncbi:MAG: flavin reductase [Spirochaetes bacterium]|nr:flavin reductase [Spirochaetota bacterium]